MKQLLAMLLCLSLPAGGWSWGGAAGDRGKGEKGEKDKKETRYQGKSVKEWIKASQAKDAFTRGRAVDALGKIGGPDVIEPLAKALQDKDHFVRKRAVEALSRVGGPK